METIATQDEALMDAYLDGEELSEAPSRRRSARAPWRSSSCRSCAARRSRTRACSRCSTPSSTSCRARSTSSRPTASSPRLARTTTHPRPQGQGVRRAGLQDRRRPVRQAHLLPGLQWRDQQGRRGLQLGQGRPERLGRILLMHANQREDLEVVWPGTSSPVSASRTSPPATACDREHPIILERMEFPEPVIHVAIEPKTKADQEKLGRRSSRWPRRTPHSASAPTKRPGR